MRNLLHSLLSLILLFPTLLFAQEEPVINSNYLVEQGISPKVLDAAFNSLLQEGGFTQNMDMELIAGEELEKRAAQLEMIFDPRYEQGLDVRYVYDVDKGLVIKKKKLKNFAETIHFFSRTKLNYFYDESSLKMVSKNANEEVIEFKYRHELIPSSIKRIKKLSGKIYINNGRLDRVELTNEKPFRYKGKVLDYKLVSYFKKAENAGGYLVSATDETLTFKKGKGTKTFNNKTTTTKYFDEAGISIKWQGDDVQPLFANSNTDTIKVGLGPIFPIFGRAAKKVGYDLPRPFGFDVFTHLQQQKMQFTDLSIQMNDDGDTINFNSFFDYDNSQVLQTTGIAMGRADMWVFPFLDIMVLAGVGTSQIDAPLKLDEEVKEELKKIFEILPGLKPEDVPDQILIETTVNSQILGGGATLAWGYKNFNISVSGMYMQTKLLEANTTNKVWIISPLVGYMTPWFNVMAGAQAQFYNTRIKGSFVIDPENTLNYNVDFVAQKWNFIFGLYKDMFKHFIFSAQFGFGSRQSMTVIIGYRI